MFYLIMPSLAQRLAFIQHLRAAGIMSVFHYVPLHASPMGLRLSGRTESCPVTEDMSDRLVRLPFFNGLSEADQESIALAAMRF